MGSRLQVQTLVEMAYEALKKDISERVLVPGQKIILREMNERYGISETPIKQALNRLIAEGVVESTPRKGVRVREIRWEEIEELMDIRIMFETYCIPRLIKSFQADPKINEAFLKNLAAHHKTIETANGDSSHLKNYSRDIEFHQLILNSSQNKKIIQMYQNLGTHAYVFYEQSLERINVAIKEHEGIYQALVELDEAKMRQRVEQHILNAKERIYQMLQKEKLLKHAN